VNGKAMASQPFGNAVNILTIGAKSGGEFGRLDPPMEPGVAGLLLRTHQCIERGLACGWSLQE
jgi:hypothetical protein